MKKVVSIVLLGVMVLSLYACGGTPEEENSTMTIGGTSTPGMDITNVTPTTPGSTLSTSPDLSATTPGADTTATPDPNATATPTAPSGTPGDIDPKATPTAKPTDGGKTPPKNLSEAKKINRDAIGWIDIPNTNIDYPIMYDKDLKYHDRNIFGEKVNEGSIYSYYETLTRNNVVTGHNMRVAGTMMNGLHKLQDNKSNLSSRSNRIFEIDLYGHTKWEVFALYETKDNEPESTLKNNYYHYAKAEDKTKLESWIKSTKERSEVSLDVSVNADDVLLTLITCGDNYDRATAQSRLYFFLKAVE